jgi:hypothetical protein
MTNRGNVNTDEVRSDNKQGDGPLLQTAASAYTAGNLVKSGSDGRLVDAGIAAASLSGGGGGPATPLLGSDGTPLVDPASGEWIFNA